jgi:hypothetical protein
MSALEGNLKKVTNASTEIGVVGQECVPAARPPSRGSGGGGGGGGEGSSGGDRPQPPSSGGGFAGATNCYEMYRRSSSDLDLGQQLYRPVECK